MGFSKENNACLLTSSEEDADEDGDVPSAIATVGKWSRGVYVYVTYVHSHTRAIY